MTPERLQAMQEGRQRARERRQRLAVQAVRDYRRWCLEGCRRGVMPPVPSDGQYRLARAAGEPFDVLELTHLT